MKGLLKFTGLVAVLLVIMVGIPVGALFYLFFVAEQISVDIAERGGDNICLSVPASVVSIPLAVVDGHMILDSMTYEDREELRELRRWQPAIEALTSELEKAGDVTLVEVDDEGDHVRIVKEGTRLRVLVDSGDGDRVRISVPSRVVTRAVDRLSDL